MSDVGMTDTNAMREARQQEAVATLDVFLAAYTHEPDGALARPIPDDDLLTWSDLRAILALLATDRAAGVGEEALVYANCKGMIGDLPGGRDPEEFCDTCYRDALAASPPAPADASSLDPLLCRCENARRKGIPMLCVQCTGPVGSQTPPGAK